MPGSSATDAAVVALVRGCPDHYSGCHRRDPSVVRQLRIRSHLAGKGVFLSVALPLIYAYSLRFAVQPTLRGWLLLGASQIAAVGLTSSALWTAPVSALLALAAAFRPSPQSLKIAAIGVLSSVYVLVQAALLRARLTDLRASWSLRRRRVRELSSWWPLSPRSATPGSCSSGSALCSWPGPCRPPASRAASQWSCPLVLLVALLNPYVADLGQHERDGSIVLAKHVGAPPADSDDAGADLAAPHRAISPPHRAPPLRRVS